MAQRSQKYNVKIQKLNESAPLMTDPPANSSTNLLFSSDYSPIAGIGAFRLQYLLTEMELELLGSEIFHRTGDEALIRAPDFSSGARDRAKIFR